MLTGPGGCGLNFDIIIGERAGGVLYCACAGLQKWTRVGLCYRLGMYVILSQFQSVAARDRCRTMNYTLLLQLDYVSVNRSCLIIGSLFLDWVYLC